MADASSLLASIISGTSPLAPDMLQAYKGAQLSGAGLDPNYGHNEGPFGALGKMLAAARGGPMLQQGVQAATAGNMAAMPDLAKLLASPDPYTALAGNVAGTDPVATARLLNGATPEAIAKTRLYGAEAALKQLDVGGYQRAQDAANRTPAGGAMPPGKIAGAPLPSGPSIISGVTAGRGDPGDSLFAEVSALPPDQRPAKIASLTPQQRLALAAAAKKKGMANAARPRT